MVTEEKRVFKMDMVRFYAVQLVKAVSHLHERRIMHRDLKTENVLIDEDGYLRVIDFGLSK